MAGNWKSVSKLGGKAPGVDPYCAWARATHFAGLGGSEAGARVPVIVELAAGRSAKQLAEEIETWPQDARIIRIPSAYRTPPLGLEDTRFYTALVSARFFDEDAFGKLNARYGNAIIRFQLARPFVPAGAAGEPAVAGPSAPAPRSGPPPVMVGVIDDGIAFAHERFREPGGGTTRIDWFWDQDEPGTGGSGFVSPAAGFDYGRELTGAAIDQLLTTHRSAAGLVNEDALYRSTGSACARRATHGAHVADVAAGCDPRDAANAPRIVAVQLPKRVTGDASGYSLAVHVIDALRYILDRADRIAAAYGPDAVCPVVVNLSYGDNMGSHDGSSLLEGAIDELIGLRNAAGRPLSVVVPAGNMHLSGCHAKLALDSNEAKSLAWRIQPDDRTPSFLEIWLPQAADGVEVQLTPPGGDPSGWVAGGAIREWEEAGATRALVVHAPKAASSLDRGLIFVAVAPTAHPESGRPLAPSGDWRVELRNASGAPLEANAWIQRDDTVIGYRRGGRQSYFVDPDYESFDRKTGRVVEADNARSVVKRANTLSGIATGKGTVVVGGFRRVDGKVASYSARGPEVGASGHTAHPVGPTLATVSEDAVACRGVLAAGTRSGSIVAMNGTSVAAPQVTRLIAAKWGSDRTFPATPAAIRELVAVAAANLPQHATAASERVGAGRLDCPPPPRTKR